MKLSIPTALDDPMIRECERITHGETLTIVELSDAVTRRQTEWLKTRPGWCFTKTALVKSEDGSPSPAYDVLLWYHRPRTPEELEAQEEAREAWLAKKQTDYLRREEDQRVLLEEIMASQRIKTP